jgi:starch synthase
VRKIIVEKKLKILFICSEMTPFAKTGGLADVTSSLAAELRQRGHDVRVVLPLYKSARSRASGLACVLQSMCVRMGQGEEWCAVYQAGGPGEVPAIFIEHDWFFGREGLYHDEAMKDFGDNPKRFGFLSRAALNIASIAPFHPTSYTLTTGRRRSRRHI